MDSGSPESKLYRDGEAVYLGLGLSTPARSDDSQLDALTHGLGSMSIRKRRGSLNELGSDSSDSEQENLENEEYNRVRKRDYERRTVEGSPVNDPVSKRLNTSETPHFKKDNNNSDITNHSNKKGDAVDKNSRRKSLGELVLRIKSYKQYLPAVDSHITTINLNNSNESDGDHTTTDPEPPIRSLKSVNTDIESPIKGPKDQKSMQDNDGQYDKEKKKRSKNASHSPFTSSVKDENADIHDSSEVQTPDVHPVLVVVSGGSEDHDTGDHQENALRTALLSSYEYGALRRDALVDHLVWAPDECVYPAPTSDLLRVHDHSYLRHIQTKCNAAALMEQQGITDNNNNKNSENKHSNVSSQSKSNGSHTSHQLPAHYAPIGKLDVDTPLGPASLTAARRFCGAAMFAIDCVMGNNYNIAMSRKDANRGTHGDVDGGKGSKDAINSTVSIEGEVESEQVEKKKKGRPRKNSHRGTQEALPPAPPSIDDQTDHANASQEPKATIHSIQRAFVIGRPPGHHAGPSGCVVPPTFWKRPEMSSNGFCLLNTAAVAAAYARYTYGREAEMNAVFHSPVSTSVNGNNNDDIRKPRIAIIDIDVHHGNGTEAIVRNLQPHSEALPLPSSWSPVYRESYKPWLDEDDAKDTFFASIQLFSNEDFYPGTGQDHIEIHHPVNNPQGINCVNIALTPVGPGPWDPRARSKITTTNLKTCCQKASMEMRRKVQEMLLPHLTTFMPDLLIISAGFDAHYDDLYHYLNEAGKQHHLPASSGHGVSEMHRPSLLSPLTSLPPPPPPPPSSSPPPSSPPPPPSPSPPLDYHWLTHQLCSIVDMNPRGPGRVVSILEGGYSLQAVHNPRKSQKKKEAVVREIKTRLHSSQQVDVQSDHQDEEEDDDDENGDIHIQRDVQFIRTDDNMFAQETGDGGLVKSTLAHVCAMSGKEYWI